LRQEEAGFAVPGAKSIVVLSEVFTSQEGKNLGLKDRIKILPLRGF